MNFGAALWRELVAAIRHEPVADRVDILAANLAAYVGREGRICVALDCEELPSEAERGALKVLRSYGVGYKLLRRTDEDAFLVLEPISAPTQFAGAEWRAVRGYSPIAALLDYARREGGDIGQLDGKPNVSAVANVLWDDHGDVVDVRWTALLERGALHLQSTHGHAGAFAAIDALAVKVGVARGHHG